MSNIDFDEYQVGVEETLINDENCDTLEYSVMGLNEEAGEVAGHWKRMMRDDGGTLTNGRKEGMVKECGDVLWYLSRVSQKLGVPLKDIADMNLCKLKSRMERNTLTGSGDDR